MRKSFLMTWPFRNYALTHSILSITVAGILQCTNFPTVGVSCVDLGTAGSSLMAFNCESVFCSTRILNGDASIICTDAPKSVWDSAATAALTRPFSYFRLFT
jgi:hypothetical protein